MKIKEKKLLFVTICVSCFLFPIIIAVIFPETK